MTRAFLIGSSMALSIFLTGCGGEEEKVAETPKEWKAYQPPVATGALAGTGSEVVPNTGTGSVKN